MTGGVTEERLRDKAFRASDQGDVIGPFRHGIGGTRNGTPRRRHPFSFSFLFPLKRINNKEKEEENKCDYSLFGFTFGLSLNAIILRTLRFPQHFTSTSFSPHNISPLPLASCRLHSSRRNRIKKRRRRRRAEETLSAVREDANNQLMGSEGRGGCELGTN